MFPQHHTGSCETIIVLLRERVLLGDYSEDAEAAFASLAVNSLFKLLLVKLRLIPSNSMKPTLNEVDFRSDDAFIGRIMAKAGEYVEVPDGGILAHDVAQDEDFTFEPLSYEMEPMLIPEGYVFVMGDNRNNSFDSHNWGPLPVENIVGRSVFRYWPPSRVSDTRYDPQSATKDVAVS